MIQHQIAETLEVSINDYPPSSSFPIGYFFEFLSEGTNYTEVHDLLTGYSKVFACDGNTEIFYFFSDKDDEALRMRVYYDDEFRFIRLETEDEDSRYFHIDTCRLGFLIDDD